MRSHIEVCLGILLLATASPWVASAQFQAPTKEELSMTSDPKAPGAAAAYLYREETEDDPHHFSSVYARVKVLSEKGKELATVHIAYPRNLVVNIRGDNSSRSSSASENHWDAPDIVHTGEDTGGMDPDVYKGQVEITAIEARTIHPDGTVIPLTGAPTDLLKSGKGASQIYETTFTLPSVEVGSILEYRYQVRYDRFQSAPKWEIQQPYFVHKSHYVFRPTEQFLPDHTLGGTSAGTSSATMYDAHGEIMTDIRSVNILPPGKAVNKDGLGNYFVDFTDIPAIPQESFAPPLAARIYHVDFFYTFTPDAKQYWQKEMQAWIKDVDRYTAPNASIKSAANEVALPSDTPLEKAKKLYELVQKLDNRDIASGSPSIATDWIPQGNVATVLEHKSGSSEQIALLYLSLARAVGLNARPERIVSRDRRTFSAELQDTTQLDYVVIGVNIDGKEITLDPGEKLAPFQTLHWAHTGAGGVALTAKGKVEIILTPLQENKDNTVIHVGSLNVSPEGAVSGTLKAGFTGQEALRWRQLALRSNPDVVKQQLENALAAQVPDGIQVHVERIAALDDPSKQLVAVVTVTGSLAGNAGKRLVLPRLFFGSKAANPFPADNARTLPVDLHYPAQEQEQITYAFPSGYALEGTPQDASMKWEDNAAYQLRSKVTAGSVTTARVLARGFTMIDAAEYGQLRDFYQKVVEADRQQIVLNGTPAAGK
jgi:hypothetical protein